MSYKSIFVPALTDAAFETTLAAAGLFASKFNSHILVNHILEPFTDYPVSAYYPADTGAWSQARDLHDEGMDKLAADLKHLYTTFITEHKIKDKFMSDAAQENRATASWGEYSGQPRRILSRNARAADIIFIEHKEDTPQSKRLALQERLLTETGRPLLLVPKDGMPAFPTSALIAWNGSIEAVHALHAALPLLSKMKKVSLLTIGEISENALDAAKAAIHLKLHGIDADVQRVEKARKPTASQMLTIYEEMNAEILVMGAYSHSRWQELVFGGVTRRLLHTPEIPVLMMH